MFGSLVEQEKFFNSMIKDTEQDEGDITAASYFRLDLRHQLPHCEQQRRHEIKTRLEAQYYRWEQHEHQCMLIEIQTYYVRLFPL